MAEDKLFYITTDDNFRAKKFRKPHQNLYRKCCLLIVVTLVAVVDAEPAWFQVCDTSRRYTLNSVDCELGLWLNKSMPVGCVCLNGVWILSSSLCDKDFMLLVGSGDCFNVMKKIHSVKFIGDHEDPFAPATYVVSQYFDSYVKVPDDSYNPSVGSASSFVVSINPQKGVQRSDRDICLTVDDQEREKPVHVWKNGRRVTDRFKILEDGTCEVSTRYDFHLTFGEVYQESSVMNDIYTKTCANRCPAPAVSASPEQLKSLAQMKMGRYYYDPKTRSRWTEAVMAELMRKTSLKKNQKRRTNIQWNTLESLRNKLKFKQFKLPNNANEADKARLNTFLFRLNMSLLELEHAREIREQSVRMIQAHTNALLLNQPAAVINTREYSYFQKMRQIFLGVAPKDLINNKIVNGLTRMWRLLVRETQENFPYRDTTHTFLHTRIMNTLERCLVNNSNAPMFFVKGKSKNFVSTHGCLEQTDKVTWAEVALEGDTLFSRARMPEYLQFNVTQLDVAVELAWKIFMFSYYHCTDYFDDLANDHSEMAAKVQSLFNYRILKRWYEPEDFNEAVQLVFPSLDIPSFGYVIDRMIAAARDASAFSHWIGRPTLPVTPMDLPHLKIKRSSPNIEVPKANEKNDFDFWNNRAACLKSFTDPVQLFGYQAPSSTCYLPQMENNQ